MNEEQTHHEPGRSGHRKHRLGRRARLTVAALALVTAGALLGAGITAHAARSGWHGMGHPWGHVATEEQARELALDKTAWLLGRIDATPEQRTQLNGIVASVVGDLYPLRAQHREIRRGLVIELARPRIDRAALERVRAESLALADTAMGSLVDAAVEVSDVLTVEQRRELAEMIDRHRR